MQTVLGTVGQFREVVIRDCHEHTREDGCFLIHYQGQRIRGCISTCNRDFCNRSSLLLPSTCLLILATVKVLLTGTWIRFNRKFMLWNFLQIPQKKLMITSRCEKDTSIDSTLEIDFKYQTVWTLVDGSTSKWQSLRTHAHALKPSWADCVCVCESANKNLARTNCCSPLRVRTSKFERSTWNYPHRDDQPFV